MSRIGKQPIAVAKGVQVNIAGRTVTAKGPKGELSLDIDPDITVEQQDGEIVVSRPTEQKRHKSLHGLYRSLLANMVQGVSEGYSKSLEVIGVGYRAEKQGDVLVLNLGFSHPIYFLAPEGIDVTIETPKGRNANPIITVQGADKQMVGQVAAKIREMRPPEPYKGKGVRYTDEYVRRKAGKTAGR